MGILDAYKADIEVNGTLPQNYDLPEDTMISEDCDKEQYKSALDEMRRKMDEYDKEGTIDGNNVEINDVTEQYGEDPHKDYIKNEDDLALHKFMQQYPFTSEASLTTTKQEAKPIVIRAFCPVCGEEIINETPALFNPFTLQKVIKYQCKCGWKANLEYTYPRVVFATENGVEIPCYGR